MTYRTASAVNIMIQFATSFSILYLLDNKYTGLESKVGFVFGTAAVFVDIFAFFCVPECKGRTLEEIDQLFRDGVPIRHFDKVKEVHLGGHTSDTKLNQDDGEVAKPANVCIQEQERREL